MNLIINIMVTLSSSPIAMTTMLILQTLFLVYKFITLGMEALISIIILLVFIGGVLVVFAYLSSVSSNELVTWDFNMSFWLLCPSLLLVTTSIILGVGQYACLPSLSQLIYTLDYLVMMVYLILLLFLVMVFVTFISFTSNGKVQAR